jgi:hypothetical protein
MNIQETDIQTYASDIHDTIELIEDALATKFFNDENFKDEAMEKELDNIANRLWKIMTKLRGGRMTPPNEEIRKVFGIEEAP